MGGEAGRSWEESAVVQVLIETVQGSGREVVGWGGGGLDPVPRRDSPVLLPLWLSCLGLEHTGASEAWPA